MSEVELLDGAAANDLDNDDNNARADYDAQCRGAGVRDDPSGMAVGSTAAAWGRPRRRGLRGAVIGALATVLLTASLAPGAGAAASGRSGDGVGPSQQVATLFSNHAIYRSPSGRREATIS